METSATGQENRDSPGAPDEIRPGSEGWLLLMLRWAWWPTAAIALGILLAAIPGYFTATPFGNLRKDLLFEPTPIDLAIHQITGVVSFLSALFALSLAALLFLKMRKERMGLFLSFYLLFHSVLFAGPIELLEPIWPDASRVNSFILLPFFIGPGTAALVALFPDGRFVPRWSPWLILVTIPLVPVSAWAGAISRWDQLSAISWIFIGLAGAISFASLAAMLYIPYYRYRYISTTEQQQQTKWVIFGFFMVVVFQILSGIPWFTALNLPYGSAVPRWVLVTALLWSISTTFIPLTLTIAIMRYRLYDIDTLLSRTLVYALLTGTLGLVYFLSITVLQQLLQTESRISAVLSTLAIAVLFRPLRARLQDGIDRRFNRRRYDAELTLSTFSAALRQQVDLDKLSRALLNLIDETMQPNSSSLWLKRQRKGFPRS